MCGGVGDGCVVVELELNVRIDEDMSAAACYARWEFKL